MIDILPYSLLQLITDELSDQDLLSLAHSNHQTLNQVTLCVQDRLRSRGLEVQASLLWLSRLTPWRRQKVNLTQIDLGNYIPQYVQEERGTFQSYLELALQEGEDQAVRYLIRSRLEFGTPHLVGQLLGLYRREDLAQELHDFFPRVSIGKFSLREENFTLGLLRGIVQGRHFDFLQTLLEEWTIMDSEGYREEAFSFSVEMGWEVPLTYLQEQGVRGINYLWIAAGVGRLGILRQLLEPAWESGELTSIPEGPYRMAMRNHQLPILEYLFEKYPRPRNKFFENELNGTSPEILRFLAKNLTHEGFFEHKSIETPGSHPLTPERDVLDPSQLAVAASRLGEAEILRAASFALGRTGQKIPLFLWEAVERNHQKVVETLLDLVKEGVNFDRDFQGALKTAINVALGSDRLEILKLLLPRLQGKPIWKRDPIDFLGGFRSSQPARETRAGELEEFELSVFQGLSVTSYNYVIPLVSNRENQSINYLLDRESTPLLLKTVFLGALKNGHLGMIQETLRRGFEPEVREILEALRGCGERLKILFQAIGSKSPLAIRLRERILEQEIIGLIPWLPDLELDFLKRNILSFPQRSIITIDFFRDLFRNQARLIRPLLESLPQEERNQVLGELNFYLEMNKDPELEKLLNQK